MSVRKTYDGLHFKALDDSTGEFEAVVSVFGNVDLQGDRVMPGAFVDTLKSWAGKGRPIPVIWSHDWADPFAHIGYVDPENAMEITADTAKARGFNNVITGGLFVKGQLDVHKPFAKQVYDLLKDGRVNEWSFAYDVLDEKRAKDGANELLTLDLIEVGPTLKGANSATFTLGVKSALMQAHKLDVGLKKVNAALDVDSDTGMKMLRDWVMQDLGTKDGVEDLAGENLRMHLQADHGQHMSSMMSMTDSECSALHRQLHADATAEADASFDPADNADLPKSNEADHVKEQHNGGIDGLRSHLVSDHGVGKDTADGMDEAELRARHTAAHEKDDEKAAFPSEDIIRTMFEEAGVSEGRIVRNEDGSFRVEVAAPKAVETTNTITIPTTTVTSSSSNMTLPFVDGEKAGRRFSKETEAALRSVIDTLAALLDAGDGEEPAPKNVEEPAAPTADEKAAEELAAYKARIAALEL